MQQAKYIEERIFDALISLVSLVYLAACTAWLVWHWWGQQLRAWWEARRARSELRERLRRMWGEGDG